MNICQAAASNNYTGMLTYSPRMDTKHISFTIKKDIGVRGLKITLPSFPGLKFPGRMMILLFCRKYTVRNYLKNLKYENRDESIILNEHGARIFRISERSFSIKMP